MHFRPSFAQPIQRVSSSRLQTTRTCNYQFVIWVDHTPHLEFVASQRSAALFNFSHRLTHLSFARLHHAFSQAYPSTSVSHFQAFVHTQPSSLLFLAPYFRWPTCISPQLPYPSWQWLESTRLGRPRAFFGAAWPHSHALLWSLSVATRVASTVAPQLMPALASKTVKPLNVSAGLSATLASSTLSTEQQLFEVLGWWQVHGQQLRWNLL